MIENHSAAIGWAVQAINDGSAGAPTLEQIAAVVDCERASVISRDNVPLTRSYSAVVTTDDRNRVKVPLPFCPDTFWGSVNPRPYRRRCGRLARCCRLDR